MSGLPAPAVEFQWFLQDLCNYRCPYCVVSGELRDTRPWMVNPHLPGLWVEAWGRIHSLYGPCWIRCTGGEPTLFPDFLSMVERLTAWHGVSFDTNLSWGLEDLARFCKTVPPERTTVDISFHPHAVRAETIIEKASLLRDRGFRYICRLVAFPPLVPDIPRYRALFEEAGLRFIVNPFQGLFEGRSYPGAYTPQEREAVSGASLPLREGSADDREQAEIARHMLNAHLEPPMGRLCRSGQVYCRVTHDGTVYRCEPYQSRGWEAMGNLLDEGFRLRSAPSVCRSPHCEFEYKYLVPAPRGAVPLGTEPASRSAPSPEDAYGSRPQEAA